MKRIWNDWDNGADWEGDSGSYNRRPDIYITGSSYNPYDFFSTYIDYPNLGISHNKFVECEYCGQTIDTEKQLYCLKCGAPLHLSIRR